MDTVRTKQVSGVARCPDCKTVVQIDGVDVLALETRPIICPRCNSYIDPSLIENTQ